MDTILLQGHAVTLTFKVEIQIYACILYTLLPMHIPSFMSVAVIVFKLSKDSDFKRTGRLTDWQTDVRTDGLTDGRTGGRRVNLKSPPVWTPVGD